MILTSWKMPVHLPVNVAVVKKKSSILLTATFLLFGENCYKLLLHLHSYTVSSVGDIIVILFIPGV